MHIQNCSIVPVNSEHAVKVVSFVCELGANFSVEKIRQIIAHYDSSSGLRKIFPNKTEGRATSISISPQGVDVKNDGEINQVILERSREDGSKEFVLTLQGNQINFSSFQYTRWSDISKEAYAILIEFINLVLPDPGVSVLGLQYLDEFIVSGDINSFRASMLFDANSKYLPTHFHDKMGPWHNHMGWFDEDVALQPNKILHNLNINAAQQQEKIVVQVLGAHRYILPAPIINRKEATEAMENKFNILHNKNKMLLAELLSEGAQKDIHLEKKL